PSAPDPERLARAVAHAFLEVEAGRRPLSQLERLLSPALWQRLSQVAIRPGPGPTANAVVAVCGQRLDDEAFDAAVVVRRGERRGVLVIRLEQRQAVWRVVELARPEDGRS
ncbi:MAG: Rv3235 family protein, partial [Nitriliruptorales bacterium]